MRKSWRWEQLEQFTNGDAEEEKLLVDLYDEQASMMMGILRDSVEEGAEENWRSAAHRLKGASGNLGALALHRLCATAEASCKSDAAEKSRLLSEITHELARVQHFFAERVGA